MYVADYGNHRIQVLNSNLTYSSSFGGRGSNNCEGRRRGELKEPVGIAIDSHDVVYIGEEGNTAHAN